MPAHRAMCDVMVTAAIFDRLRECFSIERMIEIESEPAHTPRINFGKYRGTKWEDVPGDYLQWILSKDDFDHDITFRAMQELKARPVNISS
jgi:exodeoxyribonuclease X